MIIDEEILLQVAQDLCSTMLGFESGQFPQADHLNVRIQSSLLIQGESTFRLTVGAPFETAGAIASRIYRQDVAALDEESILDAVGEVANIIGGNVKGMLDGEFSLSLPETHNLPKGVIPPDSGGVGVVVHCDGRPLQICLTNNRQRWPNPAPGLRSAAKKQLAGSDGQSVN